MCRTLPICSVAVWAALQALAQTPPPQLPRETVVLTVGNIKLTSAQFNTIVESLPEPSRVSANTSARKQIATQIAKVLVLAEEARRREIDRDPKFLIQSAYRTNELLADFAEAAVASDMRVDDAAVVEFYNLHKAEHERVRARHILVRTEGSPLPVRSGLKALTDTEAKAKAENLRAQIAAGADFSVVAAAESDDTASAKNGGELGWFQKGQMVRSFEEAAFALDAKQISSPIKSPFGYHIIEVESRETVGLDKLKDQIQKRLTAEKTQAALEKLLTDANVKYDPAFFQTAKP